MDKSKNFCVQNISIKNLKLFTRYSKSVFTNNDYSSMLFQEFYYTVFIFAFIHSWFCNWNFTFIEQRSVLGVPIGNFLIFPSM